MLITRIKVGYTKEEWIEMKLLEIRSLEKRIKDGHLEIRKLQKSIDNLRNQ